MRVNPDAGVRRYRLRGTRPAALLSGQRLQAFGGLQHCSGDWRCSDRKGQLFRSLYTVSATGLLQDSRADTQS